MKLEFDKIKNSMVELKPWKNSLHLLKAKTEWGKQRFAFYAAKEWNKLDIELRSVLNLKALKRRLSVLNLFFKLNSV